LTHLWAADTRGSKSAWLWVLAGAILALAGQARPNVLAFLMIYPAFAAMQWFRSRQASSFLPLLGLCGALLMGACWGVINLKQSSTFHLLPSAGGANLYLGNKRGAKGITVEQERRMSYSDRYQEAIEVWAREEYQSAMRAQGQQPTDDSTAVSRYWTHRAIEEIKAAPVAWLGLILKKCCLSLWNTEIPNNKSFAFLQEEAVSLKLLPVRWVILLMLFPAGVWAAWKSGNRNSLFILLIYVASYSAGNVAFFICDRYRSPIWPAMAVIAAGGLAVLARVLQARDFRSLGWTASSMAIAAAISLPNWTGIKLPSFARDYLFRSIACYEKGRFPEALNDVNRSLELDPSDASALQQRGNVLCALDQPAAARQSFEQALRLSPAEAVTLNNLGVVNEQLGDTNAAMAAFRAATQCDPPSKNAFVSLACIQIRSGMFSDAEQTLRSLEKIVSGPDAAMLALQSLLAHHAGDVPRADGLEAQARSLDKATVAWVLERAGRSARNQ
jgi:Tfp pilus assembly protein PilF